MIKPGRCDSVLSLQQIVYFSGSSNSNAREQHPEKSKRSRIDVTDEGAYAE